MRQFIDILNETPLTESLTEAYPWQWTEERFGDATAGFTAEGTEYYFYISGKTLGFSAKHEGEWVDVITGSGNAFRVLATIIEMVRDYVEKFSVGFLSFTSKNDEPSRTRLYRRLAKTLGSQYPDYELEEIQEMSLVRFIFRKKFS